MRARGSKSHRLAKAIRRRISALVHNERGVETAQVILLVPLFLGLLWSTYEAWQIMSIKSAMRTAVSQAARYVTAYNYHKGPNSPDEIVSPDQIARGVVEVVDGTLRRQRGILGNAVEWTIEWYGIRDPVDSDWDNNHYGPVSLEQSPYFFQALECNEQFAVRLIAAVDWRTILLGLPPQPEADYRLVMDEMAMGAVPCLPECRIIEPGSNEVSSGPGGCIVRPTWHFSFDVLDATYYPEYVWIEDPDTGAILAGPWEVEGENGIASDTLAIDCGGDSVRFVGGSFDTTQTPPLKWPECQQMAFLSCNCPQPVP